MRIAMLGVVVLTAACGSGDACRVGPWQQQSLRGTDDPLDLALQGPGFFVLEGDAETPYVYTRNGDFHLDASGRVVHRSGRALLVSRPGPFVSELKPHVFPADQLTTAAPTQVWLTLELGQRRLDPVEVVLEDGRRLWIGVAPARPFLPGSRWEMSLRGRGPDGEHVFSTTDIERSPNGAFSIIGDPAAMEGTSFRRTIVQFEEVVAVERYETRLSARLQTRDPIVVPAKALDRVRPFVDSAGNSLAEVVTADFADPASLHRLDDLLLEATPASGPAWLRFRATAAVSFFALEAPLAPGCAN
jgi:hypothetical protein